MQGLAAARRRRRRKRSHHHHQKQPLAAGAGGKSHLRASASCRPPPTATASATRKPTPAATRRQERRQARRGRQYQQPSAAKVGGNHHPPANASERLPPTLTPYATSQRAIARGCRQLRRQPEALGHPHQPLNDKDGGACHTDAKQRTAADHTSSRRTANGATSATLPASPAATHRQRQRQVRSHCHRQQPPVTNSSAKQPLPASTSIHLLTMTSASVTAGTNKSRSQTTPAAARRAIRLRAPPPHGRQQWLAANAGGERDPNAKQRPPVGTDGKCHSPADACTCPQPTLAVRGSPMHICATPRMKSGHPPPRPAASAPPLQDSATYSD